MPQGGSGQNRSVRPAPLSLAGNRATRATRATTELTVAGGPKVRIHLPPPVSQVRTAIRPPELPVAPPKQAQEPSSTGGPRVRIHLPPAVSQRSRSVSPWQSRFRRRDRPRHSRHCCRRRRGRKRAFRVRQRRGGRRFWSSPPRG